MISLFIRFIKKIVFSFAIIYGFDLLLKGFGVIVPINFYTILVVTLLDFPGLIMVALSFFLL